MLLNLIAFGFWIEGNVLVWRENGVVIRTRIFEEIKFSNDFCCFSSILGPKFKHLLTVNEPCY